MATLKEKIAAERKVRKLLEHDHVTPPDRIEYGYTCIRLFWNGPQVVLVVDIDELADGERAGIDVFPGDAAGGA